MNLKLLVLDVDGVLTNGTKLYDGVGKVIGKSFCDHDFTAIKKFQADGVSVCWLSADKNVNEPIARDRGITFWYSRAEDGTIDKAKWLFALLDHYKATLPETAYVGDDLFDIPVMRILLEGKGKAYCPKNAVPQVLSFATVLRKNGGEGAIMDLYYNYYAQSDSPPCG
jgi:3-deoxy-D-manno-octulosonate 8-phosphate phosphatase (KDO 8-P phosphatase)